MFQKRRKGGREEGRKELKSINQWMFKAASTQIPKIFEFMILWYESGHLVNKVLWLKYILLRFKTTTYCSDLHNTTLLDPHFISFDTQIIRDKFDFTSTTSTALYGSSPLYHTHTHTHKPISTSTHTLHTYTPSHTLHTPSLPPRCTLGSKKK